MGPAKSIIMMRYGLYLAVLFSLCACDPALTNTYVVENQSQHDLNFTINTARGIRRYLKPIESVVPSKSEEVIFQYSEIGVAYDKGPDLWEDVESIELHCQSGALFTDIMNRENWQFRIIEHGLFTSDHVEYRLILRNEDFSVFE